MPYYDKIIKFWVDDIGPKGWYNGSEKLDKNIRQQFLVDWDAVNSGDYADWKDTAMGTLAYLILTDQFPRNMFREDARAFTSDPLALNAAKIAIEKGYDKQVEGDARQFFYMPFEHSELPEDQTHAVNLITENMPNADDQLLHAKAHQEIIRKFGRFPYRNKVLNRVSSKEEQQFLDGNGYMDILNSLQN